MDRRTRMLVDRIGIGLWLGLAALAVVGEALEWSGALGIVISIASLVPGVVSVVDLNGAGILDELGTLAEGQRSMQADHRSLATHHAEMADNQQRTVDYQQRGIDHQETVVDHQAAIGAKLDAIEALLDDRLPSG